MLFNSSFFPQFLQVFLACFLGAIIGLEREFRKKEAGLRTFSLVALGSCFFTLLAVHISQSMNNPDGPNYTVNVIQAVALGIGFIGSGIILQKKSKVDGLTTASALWATGAIGIGVGLGLYGLAILGTFLILFILSGFGYVEEKLLSKGPSDKKSN